MAKLKIPKWTQQRPGFKIEVYESSPSVIVNIREIANIDDKLQDDTVCNMAREIANSNSKDYVLTSSNVTFTRLNFTLGIFTFVERSLFPQPQWNGVCGSE